MKDTRPHPRVLAARFALLGALAGLPVGLLEAFHISRTPSIPVLLVPDSGYVIWFLDPLVLLSVFGLLGLVCGLAAIARPRAGWLWVASCASIGAGTAGLNLVWLARPSIIREWAAESAIPASFAIWFLLSCGTLFVCHFWPRRIRRVLEGDVPPLRLLAAMFLSSVVVLAAGIGYDLTHSLTGPALAAESRAPAGKPNIVFIVLDTVRADHLSLYGYPRPTTSHLDQWAKEGVVFDNAISASPWTLPSHASMFTGLLPHQHGAEEAIPLEGRSWTLAEILASEGYETAAFTANFAYGLKGWGYGQGFQLYDDYSESLAHNFELTVLGGSALQRLYNGLIRYEPLERRSAGQINRDIFPWLHRHGARPFFLFINYFDAHAPYLAPAPYGQRFGQVSSQVLKQVNNLEGAKLREPLPRKELAEVVDGYDNCLAYLDLELDELLRYLASSPAWNNTVVIVTSDHGEEIGEWNLFGHHWDVHRQVLHVPLIILGPGIPRGLRVGHVAATRELFSTVLDFVFPGREPFHRRSLSRFWRPGFQPDDSDGSVVSELTPDLTGRWSSASISFTTSRWHYIHNAEGKSELYDWINDREEETNLARLPEYRQTLDNLQNQLRETVGRSLRPWRGPQYLWALDGPGYSFLRATEFGLKYASTLSEAPYRIGSTQAYFRPQESAPIVRPNTAEKQLLQSLPYH